MKKLQIAVILIFLINLSNATIINIPDVNFKNALINADVTTGTCGTGWQYFNSSNILISKIDTNNNSEIEVSEVINIDWLNITSLSINDLTGIEHFTNLKFLNCSDNNILNFNMTNLINLESFGCGDNLLSNSSFINNLVNLKELNISENLITTLSISNLPNLEIVNCYNNRITSVTLNNLPNLEYFDCSNNRITSLTTSGLPLLQNFICPNNRLVNLDFSNAPSLTQLNCGTNRLVSVNIQNGAIHQFVPSTDCWFNNPNLTNICADAGELQPLEDHLISCVMGNQIIDINSNCGLGVQENSYSNIIISPNPSNGIFNIGLKNNYQTFQVFDLLGKCILKQSIDNQTQVKVDLSSFVSGYYMAIFISNNETITIKIFKN